MLDPHFVDIGKDCWQLQLKYLDTHINQLIFFIDQWRNFEESIVNQLMSIDANVIKVPGKEWKMEF